jgi:hypothetical protein
VCSALCGDCSLCFQSLFVLAARKLLGGVVERHVAKSIVWMCSFQRWSEALKGPITKETRSLEQRVAE